MDKKKIGLLFVILLVLGIVLDLTEEGNISEGSKVRRGESGSGEQEIQLQLSAKEQETQILEDYDYNLTLEEELPDEKKKRKLLDMAKKEIDETFFEKGQDSSHVSGKVNSHDAYCDGLVEASWFFTPDEYIDQEGTILEKNLKEDGVMISACAELSCYDRDEIYEFPIMIFPSEKSKRDQLVADVGHVINEQQTEEGETYLKLPEEMNGVTLDWSEKKPHYTLKFILLEVMIGIGLVIAMREKEKREQKQRLQEMQLDYPEIVSKILILCGAGMSVKQAWHKISASYIDKRDKIKGYKRAVYEEMVHTDREISDGVSERIAFRKFGGRISLSSYHRFGRLLTESIQKGSSGIDEQMKREAEDAFEARKQAARKLGEEAGTKMMLPMMLMLVIIIAIVIAPAAISFK